jgi:hypothetical protein
VVEEVNSCMIYLIHFKNLCKCHKVSPPITTIKGEKEITFWKTLVEKQVLSRGMTN